MSGRSDLEYWAVHANAINRLGRLNERTFGIRLENGPEKSARKWELAARGDGHDRLLVR